MNILLSSEIFPPTHGGSGRWFYELYSRLPDVAVSVLTHTQHDHLDSFPHPLISSFMVSEEWGLKSITGLQFYWRQILKTYNECKSRQITQIHASRILHEGFVCAVVSRWLNIPLIIFVHGEDVETSAISREHDMMARWAFKQASLVICNSYNSASILNKNRYALGKNIQICHPGADMQRFIPAQHDHDFKRKMGWENKFVLLTVGRLQARKGQDMMIRALSEILKIKPNLHYVIVGDGEDKARLLSLVDEYSLHHHVQFLSGMDDKSLLACYQQCDLFILPNRTINNDIEGFGMVLVEAQACAKTVVAGHSGGTVETLRDGETGFIIDCDNADNLRDGLVPIIEREDLTSIGQAGNEFVRSMFSWERHAKLMLAHFQSLT